MALGVLGLRFAPPETCCCGSRFFVHVAAATLASCRGTSQQNILFQMFLQLQTLRRHVSRPVAAGVSLTLWKTLRHHSMSAVAAQTMGLSRFAERWSHICPRVHFSPGHCRWLGSVGSRCSSPAHYEAHFRSPSAFDEFFLGSQRETTVLLRSTHCGFRTSCEDCSPLYSASLQTCSWTRWYAVLPIYR